MSDSIQSSRIQDHEDPSVVGRSSGLIQNGLFVLYAIELLLMGVVVWLFLFNRATFSGDFGHDINPVWGWLAMAAAGWGSWYLIQSRTAALRWNLAQSRSLLAIVVASGAVLLGILLLNVATLIAAKPLFMDVRSQFAMSGKEIDSNVEVAIVGDAANGKKWFGMSCVTCHGPTADGVGNAAPSLRTSEFLGTANDMSIASLIRNGRAATDPANKTGKVMPAKGGNPFLEESKIADLVAFLKDLDAQFAGQSSSAGVSLDFGSLQSQVNSEPTVVVHKWKMEDLVSLNISPDEKSVSIGMRAFVKASCIKCHVAGLAGRELGPTLDQIVGKYTREKLLQHMVDPSAEINEQFQAHRLLLLDGRTVTGVIVEESDEQIELVTNLLEPNQIQTILIDDIDDRAKSEVSAMPTGLLDVLTKSEIAGLVAYVDAVGNQMAAANAPLLNHWVVPAIASESTPTTWTTSNAIPIQTFRQSMYSFAGERYATNFSWLFGMATAVLILHFLWVIGSGAAVVMHRELQVSTAVQVRLSQQVFLFWSIGIVWLVLWFLLFFLIG